MCPSTLHVCFPRKARWGGGLTIHRSTGLVHQTIAFDDAVGEGGLAPGHVDRGGGQLAEVDEAGSTGSCGTQRSERGGVRRNPTRRWNLKLLYSAALASSQKGFYLTEDLMSHPSHV